MRLMRTASHSLHAPPHLVLMHSLQRRNKVIHSEKPGRHHLPKAVMSRFPVAGQGMHWYTDKPAFKISKQRNRKAIFDLELQWQWYKSSRAYTLSHFSLSMAFPRQEYWSGLPAISFSRGSSWPRDRTQFSFLAGRFFTTWVALAWWGLAAKEGRDLSIFVCWKARDHSKKILKIRETASLQSSRGGRTGKIKITDERLNLK